MSRHKTPSDVPDNERAMPTEVISYAAGPLGSGTLAFEPGFSLDSHYAGEPPAFVEGSKFGVYVVGPCIGEGGMARVYRAEHAGLRRQVALKVMTHGFARDSEGRERFLREARIAAAIKHPNVVNIFDVGVCQGIPYLVMELLEGEDLEKVLISRGVLDESTLIDLVVPVVAGLVAVHDAGIVHRDLKPGNIFLARGRNDEIEPKLLDFGISKASGGEHMKLTAANGSLMGTPFYMAPEAVHGAEMTPLSDQYALGVVLRECATGKNPFEGNNFAEVVGLIANARYTPISEVNPRLSKRFAAIVERAMSLDPANRFEDMRAMGRQLLMLAGQRTRITWGLTFGQDGRGSLALASLTRPSMPAPAPPPPPPRKRGTAVLIAGVAMLSAGVTSLFLTERESEPVAESVRPAADSQRPEVTMVMASTPAEEVAVERPSASAPAPAPVAEAPIARAERDEEPVEVHTPSSPAPRKAADEPSVAKRVAAVMSRATGDRRQQASRRPPPRPRAKPVEDQQPEWQTTNLVSKVPNQKQEFEIGSNNAPILD